MSYTVDIGLTQNFELKIFRSIYMSGQLVCHNSSSSSSSCHSASTDLPDPLSPPVSIVHCSQQVFKAISCIGTELSYIVSSCSSCLCSSM